MTDNAKPGDARAAPERPDPRITEPLACLRELVQNSLDAGSPEIEIRCTFQPPGADAPDEPGVSILQVDDFGRGMDREIIDTRFTRIFRGSTAADLVALGQRGIGFVSILALEPAAVCVDTFRGGEGWRLIWQPDQALQCLPLDEPGVGTRIQILRAATAADHADTEARAREVLGRWCRHCTAEIRFQGEAINEPFDVEALCRVRHTGDDLEAVVGYPADGQPFYGFYRHGLTLHETRQGYADGVVFKVDARGLSHTLGRDDVLHDDVFRRVMEQLERLIAEDLPATLLQRIDAKLKAGELDETLDRYYGIGAQVVGRRQGRWPRGTDGLVVLHSVHGRVVTVRELQESADKGRVYYDVAPSPLTEAMVDAGQLVVRAAEGSAALHALGSWLGALPRPAYAWYCKPGPARSDDEASHWVPLRRVLSRLLEGDENPITDVEVAHFDLQGADRPQRVGVTQSVFGELTAYATVRAVEATPPGDPCVLVINADHPLVEPLFPLAVHEPELAVGLLVRLFAQQELLHGALEARLVERCLTLRGERRGVAA